MIQQHLINVDLNGDIGQDNLFKNKQKVYEIVSIKGPCSICVSQSPFKFLTRRERKEFYDGVTVVTATLLVFGLILCIMLNEDEYKSSIVKIAAWLCVVDLLVNWLFTWFYVIERDKYFCESDAEDAQKTLFITKDPSMTPETTFRIFINDWIASFRLLCYSCVMNSVFVFCIIMFIFYGLSTLSIVFAWLNTVLLLITCGYIWSVYISYWENNERLMSKHFKTINQQIGILLPSGFLCILSYCIGLLVTS